VYIELCIEFISLSVFFSIGKFFEFEVLNFVSSCSSSCDEIQHPIGGTNTRIEPWN
jgi:hypothetical protein